MSLFFTGKRPSASNETRSWDVDLLDVVQQQMMLSSSMSGLQQTTYGRRPAEQIPANFLGHAAGGLFASGVVFSVERIRLNVFSSARFQWQRLAGQGGPSDLFGDASLSILESPQPGMTSGDMMSRALLDADLAGNAYLIRSGGELIRLRPDWCDLVLEPRMLPVGPGGDMVQVGWRKVGLFYFEHGHRYADPAVFLPNEFAHFAPMPDPLASYRGMSWMTPVIREIAGDKLATEHGIAFLENGATPNMAIKLPQQITEKQFGSFMSAYKMSRDVPRAQYAPLFLSQGADLVPVGVNMRDLDMAKLRGVSETRIAMAGGIHPVVLGSSEGMAGSSLNAGNYSAAKRSTADTTFRPLWQNFCGSLQNIIPAPSGTVLWYDERYVAFLREDLGDAAEISSKEAMTITMLVREGFTAESAIAAVSVGNWKLLVHTGLTSVQLQSPGSTAPVPDEGGN